MIIFVFRPGSFGDFITTLPLVTQIKRDYKGAQICFISETNSPGKLISANEFIDLASDIDSCVEYDIKLTPLERFHFLKQLPKRDENCLFYYACYKRTRLTDLIRDYIFFKLVGFKRTKGFFRAFMDICLVKLCQNSLSDEPEFKRLLRVSGYANQKFLTKKDININYDENLPIAIKKQVESSSIKIAIAPASKVPAKDWGISNYINLIQRIDESYDAHFFLIGGSRDFTILDHISKASNKNVTVVTGLSLRKLAYILSKCKLFVGNDSGPLHLASIAAVNSIGIFSDRDHSANWTPFGDAFVLRKSVPCGGCNLEFCYSFPSKCTALIGFDTVLNESIKKIEH